MPRSSPQGADTFSMTSLPRARPASTARPSRPHGRSVTAIGSSWDVPCWSSDSVDGPGPAPPRAPSMAQTQATQARSTRWTLEIVRGRDVGKVFDVMAGETVLGNGVQGMGGLDLRDQEAGSPRRMAARQATVELQGGDLVIRDLDSPGGTFVNRQ